MSTQLKLFTWAIVINPGCDNEEEIDSFQTFSAAFAWVRKEYTQEEIDEGAVDIMKRLPDGTLTTEY